MLARFTTTARSSQPEIRASGASIRNTTVLHTSAIASKPAQFVTKAPWRVRSSAWRATKRDIPRGAVDTSIEATATTASEIGRASCRERGQTGESDGEEK